MQYIFCPLSMLVLLTEQAQDTIRDTLQRNADTWFHWLLASSVVVAIGVVLEAPEATIDLWRWYRHRMDKPVPEPDEKSLVVPAAYLGLLLVIVGVAGEGVFEAKVSSADTAIRTHESEVIGTTQSAASKAILDAANARKAASQLEHDTQALKASEVEEQAAAAKASERAAKAEASAETERMARLRLEAQVAPRRLTNKEVDEIGAALRSHEGVTVSVATYSQDPESMILALQIEQALKKAKIIVHDRIGTFEAVGFPLSLGVVIDETSSDKQLRSDLLDALKLSGRVGVAIAPVQFGEGSTMHMPPLPKGASIPSSFIFVGPKPIDVPPEFSSPPSTSPH